jgi:hypothetical protein
VVLLSNTLWAIPEKFKHLLNIDLAHTSENAQNILFISEPKLAPESDEVSGNVRNKKCRNQLR